MLNISLHKREYAELATGEGTVRVSYEGMQRAPMATIRAYNPALDWDVSFEQEPGQRFQVLVGRYTVWIEIGRVQGERLRIVIDAPKAVHIRRSEALAHSQGGETHAGAHTQSR